MQIFHFVLQMNALFLYILFSITYIKNIVFLNHTVYNFIK